MEVHLTAEQQEKLTRLASDKGCDTDALAQEGTNHYLEQESRFIEAVSLGEAELERGEYLTHEEVGTHIGHMLDS